MEVWVVRYDFERRPPQQSLDSIDYRFKREFYISVILGYSVLSVEENGENHQHDVSR
jgi:hypothetical protein